MDNMSLIFRQLMPKAMFMGFADGDGGGDGSGDGDGKGGSGDGSGGSGDGGAGDGGAGDGAQAFSWKGNIGEDLSKAPSLGKFEDTKDGIAEMAKSYVNLEKLLGHEKVPLPKGADDAEGIAAFNKAIGVPATSADYNLPDAVLPKGLESLAFDKDTFAQIVHKYNLTPQQATGLWKEYTEMSGQAYDKSIQEFSSLMDQNINKLRQEWGDAFPANIELGDMVINKFADDQEMGDWLTATLGKDPRGMKFLAKIGTQFSENKIGEFQFKKFAMTPEEAAEETQKMRIDPDGAYQNQSGKFTEKEHQDAVERYNRLLAISMGKKV